MGKTVQVARKLSPQVKHKRLEHVTVLIYLPTSFADLKLRKIGKLGQ